MHSSQVTYNKDFIKKSEVCLASRADSSHLPELRVNPLTFLGLVVVTVLAAVPEQTYGIPSLPGDFHPGMCHVRDSILLSSWFLGDV